MSLTFHIYSFINVILIGFFGQEFNFFLKGFKRKNRFIMLSILSAVSFIIVILFDILELKSLSTLIYDISLSVAIFSLMFLRNLEMYKVMKKANKKKNVKRLNVIFYTVIIFMALLPFIAIGIYSAITGSNNLQFINENLGYALTVTIAYIVLIIFIILFFGKLYYKHYLNQVSEDDD